MQSSTTSPSSPPSHTHTITPPTSNAGPSTPSPSHDSATAGTVTGPYSTYTMPPLIPIAGPNPTGAGQLDPNRGLPPSLHLITASTILEFLVHHSAGRGGSYTSPNNGGKWYHWQDLYEVVAGASVVIPQEVWEAALKGQSTYAEIGAGLRALGAWMQRHEGIEGVLGTREALKGREREVFTGRELGTLWREVCYHSLRLNGGLRRPKGESVPPLDESSMDRMLALSVEGFEKETGGMQGWKGLAEKKKRRLLMDMLKWLTQWSLHYMRMDTNGTIGNSRLSWVRRNCMDETDAGGFDACSSIHNAAANALMDSFRVEIASVEPTRAPLPSSRTTPLRNGSWTWNLERSNEIRQATRQNCLGNRGPTS